MDISHTEWEMSIRRNKSVVTKMETILSNGRVCCGCLKPTVLVRVFLFRIYPSVPRPLLTTMPHAPGLLDCSAASPPAGRKVDRWQAPDSGHDVSPLATGSPLARATHVQNSPATLRSTPPWNQVDSSFFSTCR